MSSQSGTIRDSGLTEFEEPRDIKYRCMCGLCHNIYGNYSEVPSLVSHYEDCSEELTESEIVDYVSECIVEKAIHNGMNTMFKTKHKNAIDIEVSSYQTRHIAIEKILHLSKLVNFWLRDKKTKDKFYNYLVEVVEKKCLFDSRNNIYSSKKLSMEDENLSIEFNYKDNDKMLDKDKTITITYCVRPNESMGISRIIGTKLYLLMLNSIINVLSTFVDDTNPNYFNVKVLGMDDENTIKVVQRENCMYQLLIDSLKKIVKCSNYFHDYLIVGPHVIYRYKKDGSYIDRKGKYCFQGMYQIDSVLAHINDYTISFKKKGDYFKGNIQIMNFVNENYASQSVDEKFKILKKIFKNIGKNINMVMNDKYVVDYIFDRNGIRTLFSRNHLSTVNFSFEKYTMFTCNCCCEDFVELTTHCCTSKCYTSENLMCRKCCEMYINAKIDNNIDEGCKELNISCPCGNKLFLKTSGSQNKSQFCYIINVFDFLSIAKKIRIWRFNMITNFIKIGKITDETRTKFKAEQAIELVKLKKENPNLMARNCPLCGIIVIKDGGCNAVVCMNRDSGCTGKFCIGCGKLYSDGTKGVCNCTKDKIAPGFFEFSQIRQQRHGIIGSIDDLKNYNKRNLAKIMYKEL